MIYKYKYINKLKSERGAIDKVLVTLLFVIIGVSSLIVIENWFGSQKNSLLTKSNTSISDTMNSM